MSREIKFRAWDTKHKEWIGAEIWLVRPDGTIITTYFKNGVLQDFVQCDGDRFILMPFTGLRDKNGVEIYEGNVVRHSHPDPDFRVVAEVVWNEDLAGWTKKYAPNRMDYTHGHGSQKSWAEYEVIANIWESPALLSESKS